MWDPEWRPQNDADKIVEGTEYPGQKKYDSRRKTQVDHQEVVRAQELGCSREVLTGFSHSAGFASGFTFKLTGHYRVKEH